MIEFPSKDKHNAENATGLIFMRTYNTWHREIKKQLKTIHLTHPQFVVLTSLGYVSQFESEVTQAMIAKLSGMDVMSISQILGLLENHGLIVRKEHSKDTRAKAVAMTQIGQERLKQALPIVEQIDIEYFGSLKEQESVFIHLLHALSSYSFEK